MRAHPPHRASTRYAPARLAGACAASLVGLSLAVLAPPAAAQGTPAPPVPPRRVPGPPTDVRPWQYAEPPRLAVGDSTPGAGAAPVATAYACGTRRLVADVWPDSVRLLRRGAPARVLPAARSASGARYAAGDDLFWSRGTGAGHQARLVLDGREAPACRALAAAELPWERARADGVDVRALRQEPGWLLEVREGRSITWLGDYGRTRVVVPAPAATGARARRTYDAVTEAHRLRVVLETRPGRPCRDAMSGFPHPMTVTVTLDGRTYTGCGRDLRDGGARPDRPVTKDDA